MTHDPKDPGDRECPGGPDSADGAHGLDEDAAWRAIVANYGERVQLEDEPRFAPAPASPVEPVETSEDEGHFVPPDPPLPPLPEPRRRAAWIGVFGAPLAMLLAVVVGWRYPGWVMGLLAAGFVGGFVYLVATMPRDNGDGSSGDGAVV